MRGFVRLGKAPIAAGLCVLMLAGTVRGADQIAVIKLSGSLQESPGELDMSGLFGNGQTNMFDLLQTLRKARTDKNLKAVIFDIQNAGMGFAQIQELRAQFEALKAADKDVLIYTEELTPGTLLLGSAATKLIMTPTGWVDFRGIYAESSYYKNLLDKIGLQADIIHCGDYKSAGEPFYRTEPSPAAEEQTNWLLDSLFDHLLSGIAKSRGLTKEDVKKLVDKGLFHAKDALEAKLIDATMYREDFAKSVKRKYGEKTKINREYGRKKGPDIDFDNPFAMFKLLGDLMKGPEKSNKQAIAVVYVEGPITSGETEQGLFGGAASNCGSETVRKAIDKAAADETVEALVLRVDSPGGSALASDVICEATKRFKDSGRPFIVSMGDVAGSGGYYVATLGDMIFADPATITGSIGVVGGKFVTKGLWEWVGVTSKEYKRGERADLLNTNRPYSEDERKIIQSMMTRVYDEFKARVKDGRGDKLKGEIESLAGGRVYSGSQGLEKGLVDKLGGMADAIKFAADKADLSDYEVRVYPQPKTIFDLFAESFGGKEDDDGLVSGHVSALVNRLPTLKTAAGVGALDAIRAIDPIKARDVERFLTMVDMMQHEGVLLLCPTIRLGM